MKYILSLCILLGASALSAQTDGGGQVEDIIDALQERVPGKGTVTVRGRMLSVTCSANGCMVRGSKRLIARPFRKYKAIVHKCSPVITSVNPKMRLSGKKKKLRNFSLMSRLMMYNVSFWRLRIGRISLFRMKRLIMQRLLMDALPTYRKEMYIVREEVKSH